MNFMVEDIKLLNFTKEWSYLLISKLFIYIGYIKVTSNW